MSSLSPKALIREAYDRRLDEGDAISQQKIADVAGLPQARVGEALSPNGREPYVQNLTKILAALGYELALVDVGRPATNAEVEERLRAVAKPRPRRTPR